MPKVILINVMFPYWRFLLVWNKADCTTLDTHFVQFLSADVLLFRNDINTEVTTQRWCIKVRGKSYNSGGENFKSVELLHFPIPFAITPYIEQLFKVKISSADDLYVNNEQCYCQYFRCAPQVSSNQHKSDVILLARAFYSK